MAAVDRLLHFAWSGRHGSSPIKMVGYVFIHELAFGEIIRDTERSIDNWIGAHYGPFNGIDRLFLPMMPRLTRTSSISAHGTSLSGVDPSSRPTGYAAFCVSYEFDQPR